MLIHESVTNVDGRCPEFLQRDAFRSGRYKLHFDVEKYFKAIRTATIYPFIEVCIYDVIAFENHFIVSRREKKLYFWFWFWPQIRSLSIASKRTAITTYHCFWTRMDIRRIADHNCLLWSFVQIEVFNWLRSQPTILLFCQKKIKIKIIENSKYTRKILKSMQNGFRRNESNF